MRLNGSPQGDFLLYATCNFEFLAESEVEVVRFEPQHTADSHVPLITFTCPICHGTHQSMRYSA